MIGQVVSRTGRCGCLLLILFFVSWSPVRAQIDADYVLYMGQRALSVDDNITAIHYFNQVIEAKPFLYKPYYFRAYAKFSLEDYAGAEADCSKAIELNPYIAELYKLRGLCRIHNEDLPGAIADYTRAIEDDSDDQYSLYNRGLCYLEQDDFQHAEADVDKLLSKWPRFYRAYMVKAQLLLEQKDTVAGLMWVDSLLTMNPREASAWSFKGRYALQHEQYQAADSFLTKAIALQPHNFENYLARALARHGMNKFSKAIEDYDETITLVPQHFVAHYNRGLLRALIGDDNRAIEDFDFVVQQEPDNTLAIYNRALLRQQTGDYSGAIADFTKLIKQYPNFVTGYLLRAECRRKVGDIRGALNDESVVAKANLDLTYGKRQRRPVKEVRSRNDHSLDHYEQLVDEDRDSTGSSFGRLFAGDLFGKVQNKKIEAKLLPMFVMTFRHEAGRGYQSVGFSPALERLNRRAQHKLYFSAERPAQDPEESEQITAWLAQEGGAFDEGELCLLRSVASADAYDYSEALRMLTEAEKRGLSDAERNLARTQRAAIMAASAASVTMSGQSLEGPDDSETGKLLPVALAEAMGVVQSDPQNAYAYYNRGCLQAQAQKSEAAISDFTQAIKLDSRFAEAYFNRGVLYLRLGNMQQAIEDFSKAGELGLYQAYSLLKQARQRE